MTVPPAASGPRASMGNSAGLGSVIGRIAGPAATSCVDLRAGNDLDTTADWVPTGRPAGVKATAPLAGRLCTRPATVAAGAAAARFSDLVDGSPKRTGIGAPDLGAALTAVGAKGGAATSSPDPGAP